MLDLQYTKLDPDQSPDQLPPPDPRFPYILSFKYTASFPRVNPARPCSADAVQAILARKIWETVIYRDFELSWRKATVTENTENNYGK